MSDSTFRDLCSDYEITTLFIEACQYLRENQHPESHGITSLMVARETAKRALARFGTTPIPVAERLPGEGDCDAEGRCWQEEEGTSCDPPAWILVHRVRIIERARGRFLPFHALPLPAAPGEGA